MSIYSENRNIANRLIAFLNKLDIDISMILPLMTKNEKYKSDYFNIKIKYRKDGDVRLCEERGKLYLGWNLKVSIVDTEEVILKNAISEFCAAFREESEVKDFESFLKSQGIDTTNDMRVTTYMYDTLYQLGRIHYNYENLLEYPPFAEYYHLFDGILDSSNYTVRRNPKLLKSVKDKSIIPYVILEDDGIRIVSTNAKKYVSSASIDKLFTVPYGIEYISSKIFGVRRIPIGDNSYGARTRWETVDINLPDIDNDYIHKYCFDVKG